MAEQPPMQLTYVRLLVRDFGEAFRFWRDTVGLTVKWGEETGRYAEFDTGGAAIAIFPASVMAEETGIDLGAPESGQRMLVNLSVEDVDAVAGELEDRGISLVGRPADHPVWGIRTAYFRDPEGRLFELYSDLPEGTE